MASVFLADQLQDAIESMVAQPDTPAPKVDLRIGELLGIAAELRFLPDPAFRARLKAELLGQEHALTVGRPGIRPWAAEETPVGLMGEDILPTLFGAGHDTYPVQRGNFGISLAMHAALLAIVATAGLWPVKKTAVPHATAVLVTDISPYQLPASSQASRGGGGGGDRDKVSASKGSLPRFARNQITPPSVVVRNEQPRLPVEATVVGPPALTIPSTSQVGDPLSAFLQTPSNGPGFGGGIGSGSGGGIGSGEGPGVGPGKGGGIGGGVYHVGGGVSAPRAIFDPEPQYSDEARRAKYQGTVVLWVVVGPDGRPRDLRVARSLGMGLDEKAIDAVRQWKFQPAIKDGRPVAVQVDIEVDFRLY